MRRGLWFQFAVVALTLSLSAAAQVPTADQLELLRSMSPEDRAALMVKGPPAAPATPVP